MVPINFQWVFDTIEKYQNTCLFFNSTNLYVFNCFSENNDRMVFVVLNKFLRSCKHTFVQKTAHFTKQIFHICTENCPFLGQLVVYTFIDNNAKKSGQFVCLDTIFAPKNGGSLVCKFIDNNAPQNGAVYFLQKPLFGVQMPI